MDERLQAVTRGLAARYETERELGRGGAAVVFLARDLKLHRPVAIKVLLPEIACGVSIERFLREIQIAARLAHPHIVSLLDSGAVEGLPYYVMPFVDGESLRARLARVKRLPLDDALRVGREVADALDYAHAVGVVHRDIKPENILMSAGHAVVADFGIARAITAAVGAFGSGAEMITATNIVVGTIAYMSPEQAAGDPQVDGRSDIYSLGVVLYEMLAGTTPYPAAKGRFTKDPPLLRDARSDTPVGIERAVMRALALDPADRFLTAHDLLQALEAGHAPAATSGAAGAEPASIAVLPFANLSGDPESEFISDGMTDEIINALMRLRRVQVVARTTVFALKGKHEDVRETGRRLKVRSVLEGGVRRAGGSIRIRATLINVADGFQSWFGEFDREMGDVIALQDEMAQSIVQTIAPSLLGVDPPGRAAASEEAYELYLRGRHLWNQRTPNSMAKAGECFRAAIERDPEFALAYAGQADLYSTLTIYGFLAPQETLPRMRDAAVRALALEPSAAEPHAALATVHAMLEWNWSLATTEFKRAIAINPQYPMAYVWYANYVLIPLGRFDEAIAELGRARSVDPLSPVANSGVGMAHYFARRQEQADAELRRVIDLDPNYIIAHFFLGRSLVERGRFAEGIASLSHAMKLSGGNPWATAEIGYAHARAGDRENAESAIKMLKAQSSQRYVSSCFAALVHAALGDTEEAIAGFEKGIAERAHDVIWLGVHPGLDALRTDPRFRAMLQRTGLIAP